MSVILLGALGSLFAVAFLAAGTISTSGSSEASALPDIGLLRAAGHENGRLPAEALVTVSTRANYECRIAESGGAALSWLALVALADADGLGIEGGWCYRTYDEQLYAWTSRSCFIPGNCDGDPFPLTAVPGTSNHGWGLAVDVWGRNNSLLTCSSVEFGWLMLHAPALGWVHPTWASCFLPSAEPWHWEFVGTDSEIPLV
jgi:hypothetical protein